MNEAPREKKKPRGKPFLIKISPEQRAQFTVDVLDSMYQNNWTASRAIREQMPRYGISRAQGYRILELEGVPAANISAEWLVRRGRIAARARRMYSLDEKQAIVNRLVTLAELETTQIESEFKDSGVMTDALSRRASRAVSLMHRALNIDERLVKAGIPIAGHHAPEPQIESEKGAGEPPASLETLLQRARENAARLRAEQEAIG